MESIIGALKDTPIPTILVVAGIVFLLLAIAGQVAGRIAVAPERQRWAALIGGGLLAIGLALHIVPLLQSEVTPPTVKGVPTSEPFTPPAKEPPQQPSGEPPSTQRQPESSVQASTEEKEPNDEITTATVVTEGITIRGLIGTDQDRDFFKLNPSGYKTRVILRTPSDPSFVLMVIVYDYVEKMLAMHGASVYQPATVSFASIPGSVYYIMVKPVLAGIRGNYELVVRTE